MSAIDFIAADLGRSYIHKDTAFRSSTLNHYRQCQPIGIYYDDPFLTSWVADELDLSSQDPPWGFTNFTWVPGYKYVVVLVLNDAWHLVVRSK